MVFFFSLARAPRRTARKKASGYENGYTIEMNITETSFRARKRQNSSDIFQVVASQI